MGKIAAALGASAMLLGPVTGAAVSTAAPGSDDGTTGQATTFHAADGTTWQFQPGDGVTWQSVARSADGMTWQNVARPADGMTWQN